MKERGFRHKLDDELASDRRNEQAGIAGTLAFFEAPADTSAALESASITTSFFWSLSAHCSTLIFP
jgi:hypothetical protein